MHLLARLLLLVFVLALPAVARAQIPAVPGAASSSASDARPDPAKLRELKATLQDPAARQKLIDQIDQLAQLGDKPKDEDHQDFLENAGERVLRFVSDKVAGASAALVDAATAVSKLPQAERWFERQMADPDVRERWSLLFAALAAIVLFGALASIVARRLLTRPRRVLEQRAANKPLGQRAVYGLGRFIVELVPVVVFAFVGYALASAIAPPDAVRLAAMTIVNASILLFTVLALVRFVLQPAAPGLRLVRLDDETAHYLYLWTRRLAAIAVYGWFFVAAARLLGLWRTLAEVALKFVGLTLAVLLIIVVLQNRRAMMNWLRGATHPDQAGAFWSVRRRFAEVWHLIAIAYIVIVWSIYAMNLTGGFAFVARASLLTLLVAVVARLVTGGIDRAFQHGFAISGDLRAQFPGLEARANRYIPVLRRLIGFAVWAIALLTILRAWGVDGFKWFETDGGRAVLGKIGAILFILALATAAWEFVSSGIERYLTGSAAGGGVVVVRSARTRTLLPLLRNVFLIFLIVITSTVVLGELGINTAPLLAGAGVIGLAIGFGSQALVKDVINGAFILFDNTIAVGDVVDLDKGRSGLVEAMSIRAIKLRDGTGALYTVPFGDVTSVKNMARDFSYYLFDIAVSYDQDTDAVIEVLKGLADEISKEDAYKNDVLDPLEVIGVNAFTDKAVMVQARIKTRPNRQWGVGRELNRRMKKKFDEVGIKSPFVPTPMKLMFDEASREALSEHHAQPAPPSG